MLGSAHKGINNFNLYYINEIKLEHINEKYKKGLLNMKILLVGFQRSGTTLLRRILQVHPEIHRVFHEAFILTKTKTKDQVLQFAHQQGIGNPMKENWGEKVPYYPGARKYNIIKYCEKWNTYFENQSRIIHIVRHPYDIANSVVKKYKNITNVDRPLKVYKGIMHRSISDIDDMKTSITIKYENLLINPQETVFKIYSFCNVTPTMNFEGKLKQLKNKKYQLIDSSRAFAYKNKPFSTNIEVGHIIDILNEIEGVKYSL